MSEPLMSLSLPTIMSRLKTAFSGLRRMSRGPFEGTRRESRCHQHPSANMFDS